MSKYGTDAFRMGLVIGNTPGTSLSLSEDKIKAYKLFANKLWNVTRFVLTSTSGIEINREFNNWSTKDKAYIDEFSALKKELTKEMDDFKFYMVAEKIYGYVWHNFASVILEESKVIFKEGSEGEKESRNQFLLNVLYDIIHLLHPFMPFITEEIWADFPKGKEIAKNNLLMIQRWPE
jgi:valyl-tRNA synthetase